MMPGAGSYFQVSLVGAGSQGFGLSLTAFPGHKQGAGWEAGLPGLQLVPRWDPGTLKARTLASRHHAGPSHTFSNHNEMKLEINSRRNSTKQSLHMESQQDAPVRTMGHSRNRQEDLRIPSNE